MSHYEINESEDDNDFDNEDKLVYLASLTEDHSVIIKTSDTARVLAISRVSSFNEIEASHLVYALQQYEGPSGCIRASAFQHFIQNFIALEDLTSEVRTGLTNTLFAIFRVFGDYSKFDEGVDMRSLSIGLSLFCKGNKSNKLAAAFNAFDVQNVGYLSKSSLSLFLSSFLLMLTALGTIESPTIAFAASHLVTQEICKSIGSDNITFASFGEWYNDEGFKIACWIELLNLEKWAKISIPTEFDEDEEYLAEDDNGNVDAFTISLHSQSYEKILDVSKNCAREVLFFKSQFSSQSSKKFNEYVIQLLNISSDGLISRQDFISVLGGMGFDVRASLHSSGSFLLTFFDAFDRSASGYADTTEIITGSTILFDGSKSSKLMFSFELFDDTKRGAISKSEMWRFFRSLLTTVLLLASLKSSDKFHILVDEAAEWCVDDMLNYSGTEQDLLSFDDLSVYYSRKGYLVCSWLELLDLDKWGILCN